MCCDHLLASPQCTASHKLVDITVAMSFFAFHFLHFGTALSFIIHLITVSNDVMKKVRSAAVNKPVDVEEV